MKYILFVLFLGLTLSAGAQTPQAFNYQGIARDNKGNAITNKNISLRLSILSGSATGTAEYVETHAVTTDAFGLFTLPVGGGSVVSGSFSNISWGANTKFLKVEMDPAGGTSYLFMGTSQLLSVPYALYSEKSGNTYKAGTGIEIAGDTIKNTAPDKPLKLTGTGATTITGTYPDFTISSTDNVDDADIDPKNEIQNLNITGGRINLTNGGTIKLPDSSATNEIQKLSRTGSKISLSGGGDILLPDSNYWRKNGDSLYYEKGFVGIGTKSPKAELQINSLYGQLITNGNVLGLSSNNAGYGAGIYMKGGSASSEWAWAATPKAGTGAGDNQFELHRISGSTTNYPFVVTNDDKIGIGTRSPIDKLHVKGQYGDFITSGYLASLTSTNTGYGGGLYVKGGGSTYSWGLISNPKNGGVGEDQFQIQKVGSTTSSPFVITNSDYVGIGTTSPSDKLHVKALYGDLVTSGNVISLTSNNAGYGAGLYMKGGSATSTWGWSANPKSGSSVADDQFQLQRIVGSTSTTPIVVTNKDYIGINTISPVSAFDIQGINKSEITTLRIGQPASSTYGPEIDLDNSANTNGVKWIISSSGSSNQAPVGSLAFHQYGTGTRMVLDASGNLGIGGNFTPKARVEVNNGDVYLDTVGKGVILKSPNGSCYRVTVDNSGNLTTTAITCP